MFLHPWAIAIGGLALGLPLAIHWLTRPRPAVMRWPTMRLLQHSIRDRSVRYRLRDIIVLSLRVLAIALIAIAFARPTFIASGDVDSLDDSKSVKIVILDVSQSMGAVYDDASAFERARVIAAKHLKYESNTRANLIVAGAAPRAATSQPSVNFNVLTSELDRAVVRPERIDVDRALELAAGMLPKTPHEVEYSLIIVSDFQRSSWATMDLSAIPKHTKIRFARVGAESTSRNMAIVDLRIQGQANVNAPTVVEVELANYSDSPQNAEVEVTLGAQVVRLKEPCAARQTTVLRELVRFDSAGWEFGEARLLNAKDSLSIDDQRAIAFQVSDKPRFLLVTRQAVNERPSSSHFLECALIPDGNRGETSSATIRRVTPEDLTDEEIMNADLVAFDHPGKIPQEVMQRFSDWLRRGKAALYVASESIDAINLALLAKEAGPGLQLPVHFTPPPANESRRDLFLTELKRTRAPFAVFGDELDTITKEVRFSGGVATRPNENALSQDVLASLSDGSELLVKTEFGSGSIIVLNADLATSNLAQQSLYVPMMDELVALLRTSTTAQQTAICGEPFVARLPYLADESVSFSVDSSVESSVDSGGATRNGDKRKHWRSQSQPNDAESLGSIEFDGLAAEWSWDAPAQPGVYRVVANNSKAAETIYGVAVGCPQEESDLVSLSDDILQTRLAQGRNALVLAEERGSEEADMFWTWLLGTAILCSLAEMIVLLVFRS